MKQDIKQQIVDFITNNFLFDDTQTSIGEKDSLLETGVIDSTGVLELIAFIEETYGIQVEDEEIIPENLDTILDITYFIEQKLSQGLVIESSSRKPKPALFCHEPQTLYPMHPALCVFSYDPMTLRPYVWNSRNN